MRLTNKPHAVILNTTPLERKPRYWLSGVARTFSQTPGPILSPGRAPKRNQGDTLNRIVGMKIDLYSRTGWYAAKRLPQILKLIARGEAEWVELNVSARLAAPTELDLAIISQRTELLRIDAIPATGHWHVVQPRAGEIRPAGWQLS